MMDKSRTDELLAELEYTALIYERVCARPGVPPVAKVEESLRARILEINDELMRIRLKGE